MDFIVHKTRSVDVCTCSATSVPEATFQIEIEMPILRKTCIVLDSSSHGGRNIRRGLWALYEAQKTIFKTQRTGKLA